MGENQQENRCKPYLRGESEGAAQRTLWGSLEACTANERTENSVDVTQNLMEEVVSRENLQRALKRVVSNKGAPGVDGMTVAQLRVFLKEYWVVLKEKLLKGQYCPSPVKRVEIPKLDGGVRAQAWHPNSFG